MTLWFKKKISSGFLVPLSFSWWWIHWGVLTPFMVNVTETVAILFLNQLCLTPRVAETLGRLDWWQDQRVNSEFGWRHRYLRIFKILPGHVLLDQDKFLDAKPRVKKPTWLLQVGNWRPQGNGIIDDDSLDFAIITSICR